MSKLRKLDLIKSSPRRPKVQEKFRGYDREIPSPWDKEAHPGQPDWSKAEHGDLPKDILLLPPSTLSDEALELRKHFNPNYEADTKRLKQEYDTYAPKIRSVVMGHDKGDPQPFDPDIRRYLLAKIVEYIEKFPDESGKSEEKTKYKRAVWEDMFARYPDSDPLHREFPSQLAISAYWDVSAHAKEPDLSLTVCRPVGPERDLCQSSSFREDGPRETAAAHLPPH